MITFILVMVTMVIMFIAAVIHSRGEYNRGYDDGRKDAFREVVRRMEEHREN